MKKVARSIIGYAAIVLVLGGLAGVIFWTQYSKESHAEEAAMARVKQLLRDPFSARFTEVRKSTSPIEKNTYCGFVHGKNGFGAYADKVWFVASKDKAALAEYPNDGKWGRERPCNFSGIMVANMRYARAKLESAQ